jgi:hypothetical protein
MKLPLLAGLLLTMSGAHAQPPGASTPAAKPTPPLRARLSGEAVRSAVRETLAQEDPQTGPLPSGPVLSGGSLRGFAQDVAAAKTPSCLDALAFRPAQTDTKNWHFEAKGLTALPFWTAAVMQGKCR